ncbi:MAG: hypothetical protein ACI9FB_002228 [Candidatus Azotimanducaceae bacterium]|jgi:hypothetical protein
MEIDDMLNLERYPLLDKGSPERLALVNQCKADLAYNLYCVIPEIVLTEALEAMSSEAISLQSVTNHNNSLRNCYLHRQIDSSLPDDHPRNLQDKSSVRMIAYDQIADQSPLKLFYHSDLVRELVAEIVDEGDLFVNEDLYQPANYVCYRDEDESSWHFDSDNSFTMTLMIQPADSGGNFEMSPNTRSLPDQNYHHVSDVLSGRRNETIISVGREPGALCIFKGSNSLHRVTPVQGDKLRIMGVFVYEFSPGVMGDAEVNETIYGTRVSL